MRIVAATSRIVDAARAVVAAARGTGQTARTCLTKDVSRLLVRHDELFRIANVQLLMALRWVVFVVVVWVCVVRQRFE